jgi:flagellar basal body-associated protein FliL
MAKQTRRHKKEHEPKTLLEKIKHWLMKRAQGLPMTTIVIIIIVLIVLAVVVIFFFSSFASGQSSVGGQLGIAGNATSNASEKAKSLFDLLK